MNRPELCTVGVAKGRGANESLQLFASLEPHSRDALTSGRSLVHYDAASATRFIMLRGHDLPALLEHGHIDVAIGGCLPFLERRSGALRQIVTLPIAPCRLSLVTKSEIRDDQVRRIATRYPLLVASLLASDHLPRFIDCSLSGSIEAALVLDMADAVADIVDTGNTISALGFRERRTLSRVQHCLYLRDGDKRRIDHLCRIALLP